jgi:hypothetical protein
LGLVTVADGSGYLSIIDLSDPTQMKELAACTGPDFETMVTIVAVDHFLLITHGEKLLVPDVAIPENGLGLQKQNFPVPL